MLLYYITDRRQLPGNHEEQKRQLLQKIGECAAAGVDYVQLREKDLSARELELLALQAMQLIPSGARTRLLINARIDIALACGAHGVHLPTSCLSPSRARSIFAAAGMKNALIAVSTHRVEEVAFAHEQHADFVVFGPVFEKDSVSAPDGLERLRAACQVPIPVFALGGINRENSAQCEGAGAAGIAGIRFFQAQAPFRE